MLLNPTVWLLLATPLTAPLDGGRACPAAKAGAWYVSTPAQIDLLETAKFNLFFYQQVGWELRSDTEKDREISAAIAHLDPCSQLVLDISDLVEKNWYGQGGMQRFVTRWGSDPHIFGFLLRDDILTEPYPRLGPVDEDALWKIRWYYQMIRNTAEDQRNALGRDLAPGKKVIVTVAFEPNASNGRDRFEYSIHPAYLRSIPPHFYTPGDSWDLVMPYWYPRRRQISTVNEDYLMGRLYSQMARVFPVSAIVPIVQAAAEWEPDPLTPMGYYKLEESEGVGYLMSIQYEKLKPLIGATKAIVYYSANGHGTVYSNLLHWDDIEDTSANNLYFVNARLLNIYHLSRY